MKISTPCPKCGAIDEDVQTKALNNMLDTYKVGDALPDCGFMIVEGWVQGLGYCETCKEAWTVRVRVSEGKLGREWWYVSDEDEKDAA